MLIAEATPEVIEATAFERSNYSFHARTLEITRNDTGEQFAGEDELRTAGFIVEPFWQDKDDVEGACYLSYIEAHSAFELSVRRSVAERLKDAANHLPEDWQIVLKAGYRPLEVQRAVLEAFIGESRRRHPEWPESRHLAYARTFVADPLITCPAHTTGGAIDIDVRNRKTGAYVDMGCPPNTDSEIAFLHSDRLSPGQYKNRMTLLNAMLTAGFAPNPYEWWHYQYGETYWAAFYGHNATLYDILDT